MCEYYSIDAVCGSLSGIRTLIYTDMTNVIGYGPGSLPPAPGTPADYVSSAAVYQIAIQRYSGTVGRESGSDNGGDYVISRISGFVPKTRREVDTLLRRFKNRYFAVIGIDRHGMQHQLFNARASYRHTTGTAPGEPHGYQITFTAPEHFILPAVGGEGIPGYTDPVDPVIPEPATDCCAEIKPIQIAYTPLPSGNVSDLNRFVTTPTGAVYFIDHNGRGVLLNRPAPRYYFWDGDGVDVTEIILPDDFPLPDPADYALPTYSEQDEISVRLRVKMGSRWLQYDHPEGYTIDIATHKALIPGGTRGANFEFYSYQDIPRRPL